MSLTVNTNIASLNAQRNLTKSTNSLNKAMERLSSGLRINRAADDAAGLAIANSLATQVKGLNVAIRNAGDGQSLIGMADGAVGQQSEILGRIRELVVQAANDINSSANRDTIQSEIDAQVSELSRIATTTQFNGQALMTGAFQNKLLQVGANSGQTLSVTLSDLRAANLGKIATTTGTTAIDTTVAINGTGNLIINGTTIASSANYIGEDNVSTANKSGGAIAKAAAINASTGTTGVTATVTAAVSTSGAITAGNTAAGASFTINGVTIYDFASDGAITTLAADSDGVIRSLINAKSSETGVVATVAAGVIKLTAADGRNVVAVENGNWDTRTGVASSTFTGNLKMTSRDTMIWTAAAANVAGVAVAGTQTVSAATAITNIKVDTADNSADALIRIDAALSQLSESQSYLGALSNRLENTISNLQVSVENMSASESRIRDADFATETANMTRAQIIQQAGVAVLSQANVSPQNALTLLK
jgi:flagellin